MLECWNISCTTRNYAVSYLKNLKGIFLTPRAETTKKKWQRLFKKFEKILKISIKLHVLSNRLPNVATGEASGGLLGGGRREG